MNNTTLDTDKIKKKKSIYFANLVQNTRELNYKIDWRRISALKEPLLYAQSEIGKFKIMADVSVYRGELYYGLLLSLPLGEVEVLPGSKADSEAIFEVGFSTNQKDILKKLKTIEEKLISFKIQ